MTFEQLQCSSIFYLIISVMAILLAIRIRRTRAQHNRRYVSSEDDRQNRDPHDDSLQLHGNKLNKDKKRKKKYKDNPEEHECYVISGSQFPIESLTHDDLPQDVQLVLPNSSVIEQEKGKKSNSVWVILYFISRKYKSFSHGLSLSHFLDRFYIT